jgi:DNA-3-methyladenine glycosylase II
MNKTYRRLTLTDTTYQRGISELTKHDPDLAAVVSRWGNPPFWQHPPGFTGIVMAILAQQVSLESAKATLTKLENAIGNITPATFQSLNGSKLRELGFSRQKASYIHGVAQDITAGKLDLDALESLEDDPARKILLEIKGIGNWTADTYLLFALCRADVWPSGDLALAKAVHELRGLARIPEFKEVDSVAENWRPWRAVAARILWHHYLCERGRTFST